MDASDVAKTMIAVAVGGGFGALLLSKIFGTQKAEEGPLTAKQVKVIVSTWATVKTLGASTVGVLLFKNIFEIAPAAKGLFSFSKDNPNFDIDTDEGVKKHGANVVNTVTGAIDGLGDLPALVGVLKDLGRRHVNYGVVTAHYDIVGQAFLRTLQQGLGAGYTADVADAFTALWGVVAATMQAGAAKAA